MAVTCCDCKRVCEKWQFAKAQLKKPLDKRRCIDCAKALSTTTNQFPSDDDEKKKDSATDTPLADIDAGLKQLQLETRTLVQSKHARNIDRDDFSNDEEFEKTKRDIDRFTSTEATMKLEILSSACSEDDDSAGDISDDENECDEDTERAFHYFTGPWVYDGLNGMIVGLDDPDFEEDQMLEFIKEKREKPNLDMRKEFVFLVFPMRSKNNTRRFFRDLSERNLHLTEGAFRRHCENKAPSMIRIKRLDDAEMKRMLCLKQLGNDLVRKKKYGEAMELFDKALDSLETVCAEEIYVGPRDHVEHIATILSNKAECQLNLGMYREAGADATDAIIFMDQEKSRIRRAKAGIAIGKQEDDDTKAVSYLAHARQDLKNVIENDQGTFTPQAQQACRQLLPTIEIELERRKNSILKEKPDFDWKFWLNYHSSQSW